MCTPVTSFLSAAPDARTIGVLYGRQAASAQSGGRDGRLQRFVYIFPDWLRLSGSHGRQSVDFVGVRS